MMAGDTVVCNGMMMYVAECDYLAQSNRYKATLVPVPHARDPEISCSGCGSRMLPTQTGKSYACNGCGRVVG